MVYLLGEEASWPLTPPSFPPSPAKQHPGNTEDNTQARHYGMREGPKNGRAQNLSIQLAATWSFLELKQDAVGVKKQQGSPANSPKPEPARAQTPCAKQSPLPSSPDGPPSLLMPHSPPLQQVCYARTPPSTTTWMASSHHAAKSSPTCDVSPLPPSRTPAPSEGALAWIWPPPLSSPGDSPVKQSFRCLETGQYNSPKPRLCDKKNLQCWTRNFHFLIECSKPAVNNNGFRTSPCFTPDLIGNCRPSTNPTWSWYKRLEVLNMEMEPPAVSKHQTTHCSQSDQTLFANPNLHTTSGPTIP